MKPSITEQAEELTPSAILTLEIIQANRQNEITWQQRVDLLQYVELDGLEIASDLLDAWRRTA